MAKRKANSTNGSQTTIPAKKSCSEENFQKSYDTGHGSRFQSNLLAVYMVRAVSRPELYHDFQLGTEIAESKMCKFDDLVFRYKQTPHDNQWSYHYLQAKHRLDVKKSTKITAHQLTSENDRSDNHGDFSLPKYFRSYLEIKDKNSIKYCILFTNLGFHQKLTAPKEKNGEKNGIKLQKLDQSLMKDEIFYFEKQIYYKFEVTNTLYQSAKNWFEKHNDATNKYKDTTDPEIKEFINCFFEKTIFVVETPNEMELNHTLTAELSKYFNYSKETSPLFSAFVNNKLVEWFSKEENKWLTKKEAIESFLNTTKDLKKLVDFSANSVKYLSKLSKHIKFNPKTIKKEFINNLIEFQNSTTKKILHVGTKTTNFTAVKMISVLETSCSCKCGDGCLIMKSSSVKEKKKKLKVLLSKWSSSVRFFVITEEPGCVAYGATFYEKLVENNNVKIILIGSNDNQDNNAFEDTIVFGDLSNETKGIILSKKVSFQGTYKAVHELFDVTQLENIIDPFSIQELLKSESDTIEISALIPSYNSQQFILYITRWIRFPYKFDQKFWEEMSKNSSCSNFQSECKFSQHGNIEWSVDNETNKSEIWREIKEVLKNRRNFENSEAFEESNLIKQDCNQRVIILSGVAGTGKSTILGQIYQQIIEKWKSNPLVIIRLNFTDAQVKELLKKEPFSSENIIDYLLAENVLAPSISNSPFAQLLIRHRLKTSGGIVFLMDAFDEIDGKFQKAAVNLMQTILTTKIDRLYVTTRSHVKDLLQDGLFQFAYELENFSQKEQIQYFTKHFQANLKAIPKLPKSLSIRLIAKSLVKRVSTTLRDKEKAFIGIPLQCKIIAECFAHKLKSVLEDNNTRQIVQENIEYNIKEIVKKLKNLIKYQKFDLVSLYQQSIDTKKSIFCKKIATKRGYQLDADENTDAYDIGLQLGTIQKYHLQLAIETIVSDKSKIEILLPPSFDSKTDKDKWENDSIKVSLVFGLATKINNTDGDEEEYAGTKCQQQLRFIHRTYAEYYVAKYIYEGFLLDDKYVNTLLERNDTRKVIVESILVLDEYDGVRRFLDSMLHSLINDKDWSKIKEYPQFLPVRYKKMSSELLQWTTSWTNWNPGEKIAVQHILSRAVEGTNANIFKLFNDCLEITWTTSEFETAISNTFESVTPSFADQSKLIIEKFIGSNLENDQYLEKHIERILTCMPPNTPHTQSSSSSGWIASSLPPKYSVWNYEETKRLVKLGIDFLIKHKRLNLTEMVKRNSHDCSRTLHFFLFNINYSMKDNANILLAFLLKSCKANDDQSVLIEILKNTLEKSYFYGKKYPVNAQQKGRIKKLLSMLLKRCKQFDEILKGISSKVLITDREFFQKNYLWSDKSGETDLFKLVSMRNSFGTNLLHKVAFDGQLNILEKMYHDSHSLSEDDKKLLIDRFMDENLNPLYVATVYGNKETFHLMLTFLKKLMGVGRLLQDLVDKRPNGFLFKAFLDVIEYEEINMFQLMLNAVKEILEFPGLIALFKPVVTELMIKSSPVFEGICKNQRITSSMVSVLVKNVDYDYGNLNELLFKIEGWPTFLKESLQNTEHLEKVEFMLLKSFQANNGFVDWLKRLLDIDLNDGLFLITEKNFLNILTENDLLSELVISLTFSDSEDKLTSYWAKSFQTDLPFAWYNSSWDSHSRLNRFLECVKDRVGEEKLKELITHDQGYFITDILLYNIKGVFKVFLSHLSQTSANEVCARIWETLPKMIEWGKWQQFNNILWFLLEYNVNNNQLTDIIESITRIDVNRNHSTWSEYVNQCYYDYYNKGDDWSVFSDESDDEDNYTCYASSVFMARIEIFLKIVTEKLGKGQEVKNLVTHKYDNGKAVISNAAEQYNKDSMVTLLFEYLCETDQEEVYQQLVNDCGYTLPQTPLIWL